MFWKCQLFPAYNKSEQWPVKIQKEQNMKSKCFKGSPEASCTKLLEQIEFQSRFKMDKTKQI